VLLNHYSPFKVAEQFGALDALAPGRIDAGLGRANGSPAADRALETDRRVQNPTTTTPRKSRPSSITSTTTIPRDTPTATSSSRAPARPNRCRGCSARVPPARLSRANSACGTVSRRSFGRSSPRSLEEYREQFQPSRLADGIDEPQGMIAVNAVCAETDEEAARIRSVAEASFKRMQRGEVGTTPSIEEAIDELGGVPEPTPATLGPDEWPRAISGDPDTLAGLLEQLVDRVGVDEVMIQHVVADHDDALRSHELFADGVGLTSR